MSEPWTYTDGNGDTWTEESNASSGGKGSFTWWAWNGGIWVSLYGGELHSPHSMPLDLVEALAKRARELTGEE